jgi:hypothetical protein
MAGARCSYEGRRRLQKNYNEYFEIDLFNLFDSLWTSEQGLKVLENVLEFC